MKRLLMYALPYTVVSDPVVFRPEWLLQRLELFASVYLYKLVVDHFIQSGNAQGLTLLALLYFLLLVAALLFQIVEFYLVNVMSQKTMYDLRLSPHSVILNGCPFVFFNSRPVGTLLTRISSDIEALDSMFANCIGFHIQRYTDDYWIDRNHALLEPGTHAGDARRAPDHHSRQFLHLKKGCVSHVPGNVRRYLSRMNGFLQESITGMETIQIFGRQKRYFDQFAGLTCQYKHANLKQRIQLRRVLSNGGFSRFTGGRRASLVWGRANAGRFAHADLWNAGGVSFRVAEILPADPRPG